MPDAPGVDPWRNPDLPLDTRVEDLLARMTLAEKAAQTLYTAPAIERLGIPAYNWWNEALHGVARAGRATVFPQAIGLAATWDTDLMSRVATAISDEARAKYHEALREGRHGIYEGLTFWSPNINIFRDPRWGRGMETYGEDPYLAGRLSVAFVRGMQGDDPTYLKTVATAKHYAVHSGPEPDRHSFDAVVSDEDLRETYLPAFRASVVEGGAESVMCAYNRFRGEPACASHELLQAILRDEWGFTGYVVSDCWAITDFYQFHRVVETRAEAAAWALRSGTDLNCGVSFGSLVEAVGQGLATESDIDVALRRLLRARFRLGMFDPPERVPYAAIPYGVNDSEPHRALALESARKSIVLLRNEDGALPLSRDVRTIAVLGPNADDVEVLLGNYNGIPSEPVTPLEGIRRAVGPGTRVLYARGVDLADGMPALRVVPADALGAGAAEYFANRELAGAAAATRADRALDFNWWDGAPVPGLVAGDFGVRWTGTLTPPSTGRYALGGWGLGRFRLFVEDSLVVEFDRSHDAGSSWTTMEFTAGAPVNVRAEYAPTGPNAMVRLVWAPPEPDLRQEALAAAEAADAVVMVMGLSPRLEGEEMRVRVPGFGGGDRTDLDLPRGQRELVEAVAAMGKPVVLVLMNGSALALGWAVETVPAILDAWYPGQAAGTALADVLFGDHNPGGRLPVTFYASVDQLPPFDDYDMSGRTYRFFDEDPVFPFGYGLSYTTFAYDRLELPSDVPAGEDVPVSVRVRNTGAVAGEEVVQLYVTDEEASRPRPIRSLAGFRRVFLRSGDSATVEFTVTPAQLSLIDARGDEVLEPGWFRVSVGGEQPGFSGTADAATTETVTGRFEVVATSPDRSRTPSG
ncbi:MAG TPA: glycoside hydrolase family 3 C-terminal domain-containing protein [Longimicrobiales bacterium]|jgi:beta-glucosidase